MKHIIFKGIALSAICIAAASCSDDLEYTDTTATPVTQFYEPVNGKAVKLSASNTASLFFEWEAAHAGNGAVPQYELVFTTDGNINNPIYKVTADNVGSKPQATISHKTLSKIMAAAGVGSGETGSIKWGVISYAGANGTPSTIMHELTVTRFEGFAEIPTSLYLAGSGTEAGDNLADAIPFGALDAETFEAFGKLTAGQNIYFAADKDGTQTFSLKGTKLVEGEDGGTGVEETGVYRITLDFATASASLRKIDHLYFIISDKYPTPAFEYNYVGKGVYEQEYTFETYDTGWPWDPFESRYKLLMEYADGSQKMWGPVNAGEDGKPGSLDITSDYFKMTEYDVSQWDQKWKLADEWYKKPCTYRVYFNMDNGGYTHFMEVK